MEIKVPEVGESVREALLAKWFKKDGDTIAKDEALCELETDKITLDIHADAVGVLSIAVPEGTTIKIGTVIGSIADRAASVGSSPVAEELESPAPSIISPASPPVSEPAPAIPTGAPPASSPAARREMREEGIDPNSVVGTGRDGRITLEDLFSRIQERSRQPAGAAPMQAAQSSPPQPPVSEEAPSLADEAPLFAAPAPEEVRSDPPPAYEAAREERVAMTPIRRRIAERLLAARQQTAMLTTFNEADMSRVKSLRNDYREHFRQRHGQPLGLMPFFVRACVEALKEFPVVNASIDGTDIVYHHYYDIGIAIGGEKGLVVPVLRNADRMKMHEVDRAISDFVEKIRTNRLGIADLEGGTFSISNGGVYGSMLSTPILNPPQSAVLGMHAIQDRPVVVGGQIVIRPMMYLALSYDHRIIDGREAVGFLKKVKEYIEAPEELLLEG